MPIQAMQSEAVRLILDEATYVFNRIIAGTATGNLASQRGAFKNGFLLVE